MDQHQRQIEENKTKEEMAKLVKQWKGKKPPRESVNYCNYLLAKMRWRAKAFYLETLKEKNDDIGYEAAKKIFKQPQKRPLL